MNSKKNQYEFAMTRALRHAYEATRAGDVPVGAVVLGPNGDVIGEGHNLREVNNDPTAHAEIVALRQAGEALGTWNLSGCTLVVTLEPCTMCAGAAVNSRIDRVMFGAWDEKAGACGSVRDVVRDPRLNHEVEVVGGLMAAEVGAQLSAFFAARRMGPVTKHAGRKVRGDAKRGDGGGGQPFPKRSDRHKDKPKIPPLRPFRVPSI